MAIVTVGNRPYDRAELALCAWGLWHFQGLLGLLVCVRRRR